MKSFLVGAIAFLVFLVVPAAAGAVTINVDTALDEYGDGSSCSLREAITAAQSNAAFGGCSAGSGDDTILLPTGEYVITRSGAGEEMNSTGDFDITGTNDLEIRPSTPTARVSVDGNGLDRVFDMLGAGTFTLSAVRVLGGSLTEIEDGGGIRASSGQTQVEAVTVDGNESAFQGGGVAVYASFSGVNSTISGNRSGGSGGGLYAPGGSTLNLRSSTVVSNQADSDNDGNGYGGGFAESASASTSFTNVLNAGNTAAEPMPGQVSNDCYSGATYFPRHTLQTQAMGPLPCLVGFSPGTNLVVTDAMYGPLGYHGGQTPTHNLLKGSPAIGAGGIAPPDECPGVDQNGIGRIAGTCDIGSTTYVPVPKLSVRRILPKKKVIRRKKARAITVVVRNSGDAVAEGLTVCLKLPKASRKGLRFRGKSCRRPGTLAAAAVKRVKIKLAAKPKARKKAYAVTAVVKASGEKQINRKFKVRVR